MISEEKTGLERVYGIHSVEMLLLKYPKRLKKITLEEKFSNPRLIQIQAWAQERGIEVLHTSKRQLKDWSQGNDQGVMAWVTPSQPLGESGLENMLDSTKEHPLLLILDGVTDPHNLGACLRTADAAGVLAVIVPKDRAVGLNATVRKVACGAAETTPLVVVTNLARVLKQLKERDIWLVGTDDEAEACLFKQKFSGPMAVIMGSEGEGMRRLTKEHCDYLVKLPMLGSVSSLNVSVATGVTLFEITRQRMQYCIAQ